MGWDSRGAPGISARLPRTGAGLGHRCLGPAGLAGAAQHRAQDSGCLGSSSRPSSKPSASLQEARLLPQLPAAPVLWLTMAQGWRGSGHVSPPLCPVWVQQMLLTSQSRDTESAAVRCCLRALNHKIETRLTRTLTEAKTADRGGEGKREGGAGSFLGSLGWGQEGATLCVERGRGIHGRPPGFPVVYVTLLELASECPGNKTKGTMYSPWEKD